MRLADQRKVATLLTADTVKRIARVGHRLRDPLADGLDLLADIRGQRTGRDRRGRCCLHLIEADAPRIDYVNHGGDRQPLVVTGKQPNADERGVQHRQGNE